MTHILERRLHEIEAVNDQISELMDEFQSRLTRYHFVHATKLKAQILALLSESLDLRISAHQTIQDIVGE